MTDLSQFDPNAAGNPENNIFGLPLTEEDARLVIIPVPWEVTVSCQAGTARAADHIFRASLHVDVFDAEFPDAWKQGFFMRFPDSKILLKSDYLRKEAELYIDYISRQEDVSENQFMFKTLHEVNEGSAYLNTWIYDQTRALLNRGKLVAVLGGDHSVALGYLRALAETQGDFGVLQIDAHCDLRQAYMGFTYSHASIMYNALQEIPQLKTLLQIGVRDYSPGEWDIVRGSQYRVITYLDREIKHRQYEGQSWREIAEEMVTKLPEKVYVSFDIDGLNPSLCPHTGTPVPGGFEAEQIYYLLNKIVASGRKIIGFDLSEVGVGDIDWDANVGARVLFKLCNILVACNS
ncbi:MAG TPA: agmatinase family protein [Chitinophagaceae bacterium]|nr:agmatinase family protein [Chitinophagaceae bacterium]